MSAATAAAAVVVDGRNARRDRNRQRVLDAALELFSEGHLEPNVLDVADRSGVSERSVFRYFEDRDALLRAAVERHLERTLPLFDVPGAGAGSVEERIERYVEHRLELYRAVAPTARAAVRRAPTNELIREQLDRARGRLRDQLEEMFEPELDSMPAAQRRRAVAVLDALFQFEAVEHLAERLHLSQPDIAHALRGALDALLRS